MNNSNCSRKESECKLIEALDCLYNYDIERFYFIEALMKSIVNKECVKMKFSLESPFYVLLEFNAYEYKETFDTEQDAYRFVSFIRSLVVTTEINES